MDIYPFKICGSGYDITRIMEHKKPRIRNTTQFWKNPKKKVYPSVISLETDNQETSRFFQLLETA